MQAHTHSPAAIFGHHIRYVVPLFQRPYVWTQEDQWEPLWEDVRTLAERLQDAPIGYGAAPVPPHFLGAIVLDQQAIPAGFIAVRHVIDGQQRLTTLQLLLDAAQEVTEQHGDGIDAEALRVLVLNQPNIAQHPDEVFKVWPTDRDQAAFRAAMDNDAVVPKELASSRIAKAHDFFVREIADWAEVTGDPDKAAQRLKVLVRALRDHLRLVVIDLEPGDNAQVIFETLNHRGTPLLAADLVKNLVFQVAQQQGLDVAQLYTAYWKPLDGDYWRELTAQGRLFRPRIDVFLNYWLSMRLLREVPNDRVFADFRDQVVSRHASIADLLAELAQDAKTYEKLESLPRDSVEGQFRYRVIQALDTRAVTPVLLWLLRWSEEDLPVEQRHRALRAIESWLVRRALARLTGKGVNQVVLELLKQLADAGPSVAGERAEQFLSTQTADARLWPDDNVVRSSLLKAPIYTALVRARVRMLLESLEDERRSELNEGEPCPRGLTVEHVMPRAWREHWQLSEPDEARAAERDRLVHRLGNLTLVSGKLNPSLSNRPWTKLDGAGKRDYLLQHSSLKLNADLVSRHPSSWTEDDIRKRTESLTATLLSLWPRPESAPPTPVAAQAIDDVPAAADEPEAPVEQDQFDDGAASHEGKYRALWQWLRSQDGDEIHLAFSDVEQVLGMPLPPSARVHLAHWYGYEGTALGRAIRDAGWKASGVDLVDERVAFVKWPQPVSTVPM